MMEPDRILAMIAALNIDKEFAVGNDVIFIPSFTDTYNDLFQKKVYTESEIKYCDSFSEPVLRYASTWAAKEAVYKAVKQLDKTLMGWKDIEILREKASGEPSVTLHKHHNSFQISLTISHDGEYVWALALIKQS
ncbi:MAG: 4-phosphopantetheinyl transferase [Sphingobacteriales bacterium]|nr:4-phosphopantetheinyl transferase [Sphingobacteriales bacterium]